MLVATNSKLQVVANIKIFLTTKNFYYTQGLFYLIQIFQQLIQILINFKKELNAMRFYIAK